MTKDEFLTRVAGKRIVDADTYENDSMGRPPEPGEILVTAFVLDDGSRIDLSSSAQIGYDDVWAEATSEQG